MIKINGYTVEELSNFYNIPKQTIYKWNQHDPENTFKRIINRKIADNKKLQVERISKIKKEVEKANKTHKNEILKFDIIYGIIFILIAIVLIVAATN